MSFFSSSLSEIDNEIHQAINKELSRQQNQIELIASENIVSKAVLEAQGSVMTNKYAEGYATKRYYGGCEFHDQVEDLARGGHELGREGAVFRGRGARASFSIFSELREAHLEAALDRLLPAWLNDR